MYRPPALPLPAVMFVVGDAFAVVSEAPLSASAELAIAIAATTVAAAISEHYLMLIWILSPPVRGNETAARKGDGCTLTDSGRSCAD
jgi:hypothetical protein